MKHKKFLGRGKLRARLILDDGFAERPIYSIKAFVTEKIKGLNMIKLIKDNFNISEKDIIDGEERMYDEVKSNIPELKKHEKSNGFTRDERGQIVSPFASKKKLI